MSQMSQSHRAHIFRARCRICRRFFTSQNSQLFSHFIFRYPFPHGRQDDGYEEVERTV